VVERHLSSPAVSPDLTADQAQEARLPGLRDRRELKMSRDAHTYVRGSTQHFYEWLGAAKRNIPEGPRIWICGDAHVGNLGPIVSVDSSIEVELRDLDQTVLGNPAHDLIRLALSLAMAARSSDLPGVMTARLVEELTAGYLESFLDADAEATPLESSSLRYLVRAALRRKWRHLCRERIGKRPKFRFGSRFLPLVDEERREVDRFLDKDRVRQLVTRPEWRDDDARVLIADAAYWVKGCSSLGLWRCAALAQVVGDKHGESRYALLDVKEGTSPLAPVEGTAGMPGHQGARVVRGAMALSPSLGERMVWGTVAGHEVFVRELMPQDLKLEVPLLDDVEARATARALARVVGRAHARQLNEAARHAWRTELERAAPRSLDAPAWLWSTVVDLIGVHERAYLEHCRRYALVDEKLSEVHRGE
jgi:uncharacterized protein (DUF2252 family)